MKLENDHSLSKKSTDWEIPKRAFNFSPQADPWHGESNVIKVHITKTS